ncbi:hypothetical protein [Hymenobacter sp. HSC-4F20]|nr:hypothetical protein [Hymenobacter sp. HSC-4F20]
MKHVAEAALTLQASPRYALLLNDKSHATGGWTEAMERLEYE